MCLCDFCHVLLQLLYTFGPIWTNLLTQCTQLPVAVFVFQVFRLFKVVRKIQKNHIKNQRDGTFRNNQSMEGGPPPGNQEGDWRGPPLGRARGPPGCPGGPLPPPPPFAYI